MQSNHLREILKENGRKSNLIQSGTRPKNGSISFQAGFQIRLKTSQLLFQQSQEVDKDWEHSWHQRAVEESVEEREDANVLAADV